MNYQSWNGVTDPRVGYGSMLKGFIDHAPKDVVFHKDASVNVHMMLPEMVKGWRKGQHRVIFTMWETDELPTVIKPWLHEYDQVLVPCQHNVDLFSKSHHDVTMVPLGVDLKFWRQAPATDRDVFIFAAGGSLWYRKGLDLVVQAFTELDLPDAKLYVKAAPHAFDAEDPKHPNIVMFRQWFDEQTQRDWYDQADCYVAPARGEGFGLMPLQAIAMGIPTIISDSSGQKEFAHLANWVVPCGKSKAHTCGQWDEPNLELLKAAMRDAYEQRLSRKRPTGVKQFSWVEASRKLVAALPTGELLDNPVWENPTATITVKALRPVNAIIANDKYVIKTGEIATIKVGVYQVLFDSGAVEMEPQ